MPRKLEPGMLVLFLCCARGAGAEVKLPAVLGDHMVVQRGLPVHLWGTAAAGESVSAAFRGEQSAAKADQWGRWSVYFAPGEAGGPFEVTIRGGNSITLRDVLVGDVWVASGQSNMEMPVIRTNNSAVEIAGADHPKIRLLQVEHRVSDYPMEDLAAKPWTPCTPESIPSFSAVAYYFARNIQGKLGIPMGLISTSWGGTPADAWTSLPGLSGNASLMPVFGAWARMMQAQSTNLITRNQLMEKWNAEVIQAKSANRKPPDKPWAPNEDYSWKPAGLYNGMIAPLTPYAIRGVLWYQGESNASQERAPLYAQLFQSMIRDWRRAWGEGDFPFLFVQLANFTTGNDGAWPQVREAQRQALALANTGMAVTIDIGDAHDIHPKDKQDVGLRLALAGRAIAYGEKIEYSGPLFRQAVAGNDSIRVWFDHADGLKAKGSAVTGFEVAGADRKFKSGQARVEGTSVAVTSPEVPIPVYVRYGWSDNPECNLVNAEGLPASPFSSSPM